MKRYLIPIILLFFITPQLAFSQTRVEEQISIDFSPTYPGPNENVSVSIESFQTDLNKSEINYYINGESISGGLGQKTFNFTTGGLNQEIDILIEIIKPNGQTLEKNYTINPGEVDLYYEAETYTPPFYKGKSDFTTQSRLKMVAIPNFSDDSGNIIPSSQIVYTWKINGNVDGGASGLGRNIYYYQPDIISRPIQVVLEASPRSSNQTSRIIKTIRPTEPSIFVYEKNPIYGTIFTQTVDSDLTLQREEIELEAIPYGFDNDIFRNGSFKWFLNGSEVDNFKSNNIIFRRTDNNPSSNDVIIEIEHRDKILQALRHGFILNFGENGQNFNF